MEAKSKCGKKTMPKAKNKNAAKPNTAVKANKNVTNFNDFCRIFKFFKFNLIKFSIEFQIQN